MKTIVTHSVNFHNDDIFAVAALLTLFEGIPGETKSKKKEKVKVIRTLDFAKYVGKAYIVDIGGKHNPKLKLFDHHQEGGAGKRKNGVPYASFGLVWKEFGKKISGSAYAADWIDRQIVQGIDGDDSGMYMYKPVIDDVYPFCFGEYFSAAGDVVKGFLQNENAGSGKDKKISKKVLRKFDKEFMRLVNVARDVLRVFIIKSRQKEQIMKAARAAYKKAKDKRVIVSDVFIPTRFDEFKAPEYIEPLVFVYPDLRGGWSAKAVPSGGQDFDTRMKFPAAWRGKRDEDLVKVTGIPGARFCHNTGFLAVGENKEAAMALVKKAFEILKIK